MLRNAPKPKLSLNTAASVTRPKLSLNTAPAASVSQTLVASPTSPSYTFSHHMRPSCSPLMSNSPTAINTSLNRRTIVSSAAYLQVPTYNYVNSSQAKSILKKGSSKSSSSSSVPRKSCQINVQPTAVHAITPIDDADYWYKPVGGW